MEGIEIPHETKAYTMNRSLTSTTFPCIANTSLHTKCCQTNKIQNHAFTSYNKWPSRPQWNRIKLKQTDSKTDLTHCMLLENSDKIIIKKSYFLPKRYRYNFAVITKNRLTTVVQTWTLLSRPSHTYWLQKAVQNCNLLSPKFQVLPV